MSNCPFWSSDLHKVKCNDECPFCEIDDKDENECPFKILYKQECYEKDEKYIK